MLTIKESGTRGTIDHGWLLAKHSFSFGRYQDPANTGFGPLRVINEDVIAGGRGFPSHPHSDMEIITYPISGTLRHTDSLGHDEDITPGKVQRMTAGSGIRHSERNPSADTPVHLLQIWIDPRESGLEPSHETRDFAVHAEPNQLHLLASGDGANGSMVIQQDARMYAATLKSGKGLTHSLNSSRFWLQVVSGELRVNGASLTAGDAVHSQDESELHILAGADSELVLFELSEPGEAPRR